MSYEKFGKEWEAEMMKWRKAELINSLRSLAKSKAELTNRLMRLKAENNKLKKKLSDLEDQLAYASIEP